MRKFQVICLYIALFLFSEVCFARADVPIKMEIGECRFSISDAFHGSITKPREENDFRFAGYEAGVRVNGVVRSFGFNFSCQEMGDDNIEVPEKFGGRFNATLNKWMPDFGDASADDVVRLKRVTKTFPLTSKNAKGFYTIQDDLDGELSRRMRHISYCLIRGAMAVCGDGVVMRLADSKSDMLNYALQVLRSIKFEDKEDSSRERFNQGQ
ncbi:hypothetical protein [Paraburkholderia sp. SIMBA_027]|uniref:hypothetical protein n=1 Tax=Paraburkholderia sp. SIMBA_027 TaxID=3085770 RepID=UPI003978D113